MNTQQFAMFYDLQGNRPIPSSSPIRSGHPWPTTLQVSGEEKAKNFLKDNGLYLAGGGLIVAGLVAWHFSK